MSEDDTPPILAGKHYTEPEQAEGFLERLPLMLRRYEGCYVLLY